MLANTTFLIKLSHSSQNFTADNIKGSFNGTDIMPEYQGLSNTPENFKALFELHSEFPSRATCHGLWKIRRVLTGALRNLTLPLRWNPPS